MGYQLPGLGNVAFPGFGALGKQQTRDTRHAKKGKDQARPLPTSSQSPSSSSLSSSSLPSVAARPSCEGRSLERGFLQRWRLELRPLLNSLRIVEASNRESCSGVTSCIGPFQISRHYHHDAWKHSPPIAWSRCRDLNHAENTVIAYWFKYCPDAVEKHDFETLAKIHKGGPQGLQKEETSYYWSKVSQHLKEQETTGSKKENTAWVFFSSENHAKQEASSKMYQKSSPVLSPINTNTMASSKAHSIYAKSPARCVTQPKQQLPLIQTLKPRMFRRAVPAKDKKSAASFLNGVVKPDSIQSLEDIDCRSTNKRLRQTSYFHSNTRFEHGSLGHAFNMDFCHLSRADRMEKAATNVQAIWRMRCARGKYVRMRSAAVLIQKKWRKRHFLLLCKQRIYLREAQDLNSATNLCLDTSSTLTGVEKQGGNARPIGSPCELLYRSDISPNQEDELLSELVSLLNWDTQSPLEACHSFRFPRSSEEISEACTPKMKPEMRQNFAESPNLSAKQKAQEPSCIALPYVENTPLVIKQALLSPLMEKEIIAELAKLFLPCKTKSLEDLSTVSHSLVSPEGVSSESMKDQSKVLHEQCGKDGIMRRLTFNSAEGKENCGNDEIATVMDVGCSEGHGEPFNTQFSLLRSSEGSSTSFSSKAEGDEEVLEHIDIPLLVDQSPVLTSKKRVRNQNPCNRKVDKALVSSLSEWQYSVSFEEESQDQEAFREGFRADQSVDGPSSFSCKEITTSKEFVLCSLTKSLSITCTNSSQQVRWTDISTDANDLTPIQVSDSYNPDCLLETSCEKTSTVYAKAIFRCLNFSLDEYEDGGGICEKSQIKSRKMASDGSSTLSQTRLVYLQRLCMLWDTHNVDLLTRSLKFKALQAANCQYQQEHSTRSQQIRSANDEVTDIRMEIGNLENLPEESKKRELVLHQRDVIYTNIAAYCNAQERQDLYDKWKIQKLLTGRLKKIVYELLWVDPKRYQESAELVIQYL